MTGKIAILIKKISFMRIIFLVNFNFNLFFSLSNTNWLMNFILVETASGIVCPFTNRVYQLSAESKSNEKINKRSAYDSQFSLIFDELDTLSDCDRFLKIGCNNNQFQNDYSIFKKCHFTGKHSPLKKEKNKRDSDSSFRDLNMPVTESEYNRVCLAYWPLHKPKQIDKDSISLNNPNYVSRLNDYGVEITNENDEEADVQFIVLSKSSNSETFSITCSVSYIFYIYRKSLTSLPPG